MSQLFGGYFQFQPESAGVGASPGFSFGKSGTVSAAYLDNETVPSNTTGRYIGLTNARITAVNLNSENVDTYTITIEQRIGAVFTSLGAFSVTAARGQSFLGLNINLTSGAEMACRVSSGSCKNPVVTVYVKGDAI